MTGKRPARIQKTKMKNKAAGSRFKIVYCHHVRMTKHPFEGSKNTQSVCAMTENVPMCKHVASNCWNLYQAVLKKKNSTSSAVWSFKNQNENQMNPSSRGDGERSVLRSSIKPDPQPGGGDMGKDSLSVAVDLSLPLTLQSFHHWTDMRERDPPIWGPEPPHLNPGSAVASRSALGFFLLLWPRRPWDCGRPGVVVVAVAGVSAGNWPGATALADPRSVGPIARLHSASGFADLSLLTAGEIC